MDRPKILFYNRTFGQLSKEENIPLSDPDKIISSTSKERRSTLLANPSGYQDEDVCEIIANVDERAIGTLTCFDSSIVVDGEVKHAHVSSTLFSHPDYRDCAVGGILMRLYQRLPNSTDMIASGISQMAFPLHKALGYTCFEYPRFIMLLKSRSAVEYVLRGQSFVSKALSSCVDLFLGLYKKHCLSSAKKNTNNYTIEEVHGDIPKDIYEIVVNDGHRFKENHNTDWFKWCLNNYFFMSEKNSKKLFVLRNKATQVVEAFFLLKTEFYEQASSRGFKNVLLSTVSEWGIANGSKLCEADIQLIATTKVPKDCDGIQFASQNDDVVKIFRKLHLFPMGNVNMAVKIKSVTDPAIKDINNWRFRIGCCDTLID